MTKLTVRLVKSMHDCQLDTYINDKRKGLVFCEEPKECEEIYERSVKQYKWIAEALNLSFRQDGEYIYLEGK
jgi:hypothetical protein